MKKTFYITTAIDYVNQKPHLGTAYEKIGADCMARYMRLRGYDTWFVMGNDEHSTNVEKEAVRRGMDPRDYCREMSDVFTGTWKTLNISYDDFIHTTEERHIRSVTELFSRIEKNGYIYKGKYEGLYCESCEEFIVEKDLVDGLCPRHKQEPTKISEENYFFALSKFEDRLLEHIEKNPDFIQAEDARERDRERDQGRPPGRLDLEIGDNVGHSPADRSRSRDLRLVRRADELYLRPRIRR